MLGLSHAKSMAKTLRDGLSARHIDLNHSDCLELVAKQFGFANWNVLAARVEAFGPPVEAPVPALLPPPGWFITGLVDASTHRVGRDPRFPGAVLAESLLRRGVGVDLTDKIAVLMQSIRADAFLGRRLRLSAELKTEGADCGTIWLRIDGLGQRGLAFDNMMPRQSDGVLTADTPWTRRVIVLDVADQAASIHYGFFLKGYGKVWLRDVRLDVVDETVPVTAAPPVDLHDVSRFAAGPVNLDFQQL